jgi:hypothetical protein
MDQWEGCGSILPVRRSNLPHRHTAGRPARPANQQHCDTNTNGLSMERDTVRIVVNRIDPPRLT